MIELSDLRFVTVTGAKVTAAVTNAAEARHALKELRLVKREAARVGRALGKALKASEAAEKAKAGSKAARASGRGTARNGGLGTERGKGAGAVASPAIDNPLSYVWHSLAAVATAATRGSDETGDDGRGDVTPTASAARRTASSAKPATRAQIARDVTRSAALIDNIDACIAQIEARLLAEAAPPPRPRVALAPPVRTTTKAAPRKTARR